MYFCIEIAISEMVVSIIKIRQTLFEKSANK